MIWGLVILLISRKNNATDDTIGEKCYPFFLFFGGTAKVYSRPIFKIHVLRLRQETKTLVAAYCFLDYLLSLQLQTPELSDQINSPVVMRLGLNHFKPSLCV